MLPTLKIKLSKDESMLKLSNGEVTAFGMYNFKFKNAKPVPGGLFCERIFGPTKDYTCACGNRYPIWQNECDRCGVPIIKSFERTNRFGHINLNCHYINPLALEVISKALGISNQFLMGIALGEKRYQIEIIDSETCLISEEGKFYKIIEIPSKSEKYETAHYSIESLVLDLKKLKIAGNASMRRNTHKYVQSYVKNGYSLFDLFNTVVLVSPPVLRDIRVIEAKISYHPHNNYYHRLLRIGSRLKHIKETSISGLEILIPQEARLIQKLINMLYMEEGIDYQGNKISSILHSLNGKRGLLRGSLLGKRIDYSGRSSISSGPELPLDTLSIPFDMAYVLLEPTILHYVIEKVKEDNEIINPVKTAYRLYKKRDKIAIQACYKAAEKATMLMNRAPSLHRYSIMAFKIRLHEGQHIKVPPMVMAPFNADCDGDTVLLSLVLGNKAIQEANNKMRPTDNIMSSIDWDKPNLLPAHEQIIGLYELTK